MADTLNLTGSGISGNKTISFSLNLLNWMEYTCLSGVGLSSLMKCFNLWLMGMRVEYGVCHHNLQWFFDLGLLLLLLLLNGIY